MDKLKETSFPFPIADTESGPTIFYDKYNLKLEFTDYMNNSHKIVFRDVEYFSFGSIDADDRKLGDDRKYIVKDSSLVERLVLTNEITESKKYVHQIICFNEVGSFLELVYSKMEY